MKEIVVKLIRKLEEECHAKYGEAVRTESIYKQKEIAGYMDGLCFAMQKTKQLAKEYGVTNENTKDN